MCKRILIVLKMLCLQWVELVSKRKKKCLKKTQMFLLVSSQTPPSLRATSPNLGEELSMIADVNALTYH